MRNRSSKDIAFCGVTAALAVVIMCLGGFIPVATYVCPMLCMLLLSLVLRLCGKRLAWAWYAAVSILTLLLEPDKEAACVFLALGYYPILKPKLDAMRFGILWKLLLFNAVTCTLYALLIFLFGMQKIAAEFQAMGAAMLVVLLVLGNVTFFLLDKLLGRMRTKR